MTLRELLAVVAPAEPVRAQDPRVLGALHDSEGSEAPLLVRLFTVIGTWVGAGLLFGVLAVAVQVYEVVGLVMLMGVVLFASAVMAAREPIRTLLVNQLIWVLTIGAQGMVVGGLVDLEVGDESIALGLVGLQLATLALVRVPSLQGVAAIAGVGFATWFAAALDLPMYPLWVALPVVGLAIATWIFEVPWAARLGRTWSALAYGLPLGLIIPLAAASLDVESAFAARNVPGLSLALLWLVIAHLRKSVELQILALVQLAGFLFLLYYQLDTTLLLKSLLVIGTGAAMLLGAWLGRSRVHELEAHPARERRSRWLPAIALVVLTSGMVIGASVQKERVLATGQTVLLPLAPVDPRSLMQGDYMQLRYALEQEMGLGEFPDVPRHGNLVITVDEHGVGHFARFDDARELAPNERLLEYRLREPSGSRLRIGAESFFFEEGRAHVYERARFGELVIAAKGEAVLVGLRDEDRQPL